MLRDQSRTLVALAAAVLVLAPVLTGCGSDEGSPDDVPTITTRPSTPTTPATSGSAAETSTPPSSASTSEPATSATPETTTSAPSPTGSPTATAAAPKGPATYDAALARIDDVSATSAALITTPRFSTARDIVYCLLDDDVIGPACELRTGFIEDESYCGGAATDGIGRVETFEDRAQPVCNTDTIREAGARVVQAPAVVRGPAGVECAVETFGVTCVDTRARTGFFVGPGEYHVF